MSRGPHPNDSLAACDCFVNCCCLHLFEKKRMRCRAKSSESDKVARGEIFFPSKNQQPKKKKIRARPAGGNSRLRLAHQQAANKILALCALLNISKGKIHVQGLRCSIFLRVSDFCGKNTQANDPTQQLPPFLEKHQDFVYSPMLTNFLGLSQ